MASDDRPPPHTAGGQNTQAEPYAEWRWLSTRLIVVMFLLTLLVPVGNPIPSTKRGRGKARPFVASLYPDRPVAPEDSLTAPVAVVFHLIRSGEPGVARQAIDFAAESGFGTAAPYVIERLEDADPEVRESARAFLVGIAGEDRGPSIDAWRAWWRNPPHALLGVLGVGHTTYVYALPALVALAAFLLWGIGRLRGGPPLSWAFAWTAFACAWFMGFFVLAIRLLGGGEEGTFGGERIAYHVSHGTVLGLEDSRLGGGGLFLALGAAYVLAPALILGVGYFVVSSRRPRHGPPQEASDQGAASR